MSRGQRKVNVNAAISNETGMIKLNEDMKALMSP